MAIKKNQSGEFEIGQTLGSGLFAIVVKASHEKLNRTVALKIIKDEFDNSSVALDHARVLAGLPRHTNIVQVYGIENVDFEGNQKNAIVMEWIDGPSLATALAGPRFTVPQCKKLIFGALEGLRLMHSNRVPHGDLHPGNVLIDPNGDPVIIDASVERRGTLARASGGIEDALFSIDLDSIKHLIYRCVNHSMMAPSLIVSSLAKIESASDIEEIRSTVNNDSFWAGGESGYAIPLFVSPNAIKTTIQYLEANQAPSLRELTASHAKRLIDSLLDTNAFPMDAEVHKEEFSRRVEEFERLTLDLAGAIATVGAWSSNGDHERVVIDTIKTIAEGLNRHHMEGMYKSTWKEMRHYPLFIILYAVIFGCYRNERFSLLRTIVEDVQVIVEERDEKLFESVDYFTRIFSNSWNSILESRLFTPVIDRFTSILQGLLPSFATTEAITNESFDELQCFLSAVVLYRNGSNNYQSPQTDWGVAGSHLWRHQRRGHQDQSTEES